MSAHIGFTNEIEKHNQNTGYQLDCINGDADEVNQIPDLDHDEEEKKDNKHNSSSKLTDPIASFRNV